MKIGIITKPNAKGQIVIPKRIRERFSIDENTQLNIVIRDNGFYIYPFGEVVSKIESKFSEEAFKDLLKKTQGAWADEDWDTIEKEEKN